MRSLEVDAGGTPLHVATWDGDGPPMLLVHGLGGSHMNWCAVAPRLAERHRVWALDLPGFGRSRPLAGRTTVRELQAATVRCLEALADEPVILVGNSMGGMISMLVAERHPEKVAALVLVDAAMPAPWRDPVDPAILGLAAAYGIPGIGPGSVATLRRRVSAEDLVRGALTLCTAEFDRVDPEIVRRHVELEEEIRDTPGRDRAFTGAARSIIGWVTRTRRVRPIMERISSPTLVVHGDRDRLVRVSAAHAARTLRPDWDVRILPNIGHLPMIEDPDGFIEILESWLLTDEVVGVQLVGRSPLAVDLA